MTGGTAGLEDVHREALEAKVVELVRKGWRVEAQTARTATLVKGHRHSHVFHLLMSIITAGLWLVVWLLLGIAGGERRRLVTVGDDGTVEVRRA